MSRANPQSILETMHGKTACLQTMMITTEKNKPGMVPGLSSNIFLNYHQQYLRHWLPSQYQ